MISLDLTKPTTLKKKSLFGNSVLAATNNPRFKTPSQPIDPTPTPRKYSKNPSIWSKCCIILPYINFASIIILYILVVVHIQHDLPHQEQKTPREEMPQERFTSHVYPFNLVPSTQLDAPITIGLAQSKMQYGKLVSYDLCCTTQDIYVCHSNMGSFLQCHIETDLETGALVAKITLRKKAHKLTGARCKLVWQEKD